MWQRRRLVSHDESRVMPNVDQLIGGINIYVLLVLLFNGIVGQTYEFHLVPFLYFGLVEIRRVLAGFLHQVGEIVIKIDDLAYPPSWLGWGASFPARR